MNISGSTALITGAARGIGAATAEALAAAGARVALVDIDGSGAAEVAAGIRDAGGSAQSWRCDVTAIADVVALAAAVDSVLGVPDLLINNAYARQAARGTFDAPDIDTWKSAYDVNVLGYIRMHRSFLPAMMRRGSGYVVDTSSSLSIAPNPDAGLLLPYMATKGAILGLAYGMRFALAGTGVGYSVFCPGLTDTRRAGETSVAAGAAAAPPATHAAAVLLAGIQRGDFLICSEAGFEQTLERMAAGRLDPLALGAKTREHL